MSALVFVRIGMEGWILTLVGIDLLQSNQLKGLILAQNERWQRGLGMQVERQVFLRGDGGAANGVVMHRNVPFRLG